MKNKIVIYIPIIIAISLATGIFIGNILKRNNEAYSGYGMLSSNKLGTIVSLIQQSYVDSVNTSEIIENTIPELLKNLDPHSIYIPVQNMQEVREEMQGNFSGIGVQFSIQDDTVRVVEVIPNGPSSQVGLMAGDRIVEVNDSLIAGIDISNDKVFKFLRGEKGSKVKVGVKRAGLGEIIDFEIIRGDVPIFSVDVSYMIDKETGYIKINKFAETTYREFMEGAKKLKGLGATKLIIDLRGNTGGYMNEVLRMADEFLKKDDLILYTKGLKQPQRIYNASGRNTFGDTKVFVLIDEYTASASEIFAGAMQDNDRGLLIGRRTFGKGLVQEPIPLPDGSELRLTVARYYTPSGRCIQRSYSEGADKYNQDLMERVHNGELEGEENVVFSDSIKYKTKSGRVVYGGGGIMPDIFVPVDTAGYSEYFGRLVQKGIIYQFAYRYANIHRDVLKNLKSGTEFDSYLDSHKVLNELLKYGAEKGIPVNAKELKISERVINTQLKAYIARNIIGEEGFYSIVQQIDKTLLKAIEISKENLLVENISRNN
jgi:carboxyl-terminal processing protease